ncbi:MAG: N-acetyl-gamma-glutamyl-phosphate reductase [Alphaproteobacteria bacterium]|nr:N-acetyl-gamma-glutamyl-phosphate reductase [Alphaproteobacteria bacterium]
MTKPENIRVGIVGVSGYGGGELARILSAHPGVDLAYVTSNTYAGKPLAASLPGSAKRIALTCEPFDAAKAASLCDVLFLAGEAGMAMKLAPSLLEAGKKVIDLSGDFRLKDPAVYEEWYKIAHVAPTFLKEAVFGLPELHRAAIKSARLLANPGCYPTTAILALAPLMQEGLIDPKTIIVDSISGVSGAGRSKFGLDTHFAEVNESLKPYGAGGVHKHVPEIEQALSGLAREPVKVTFTPHLAPVTRGILTTAYANFAASSPRMDSRSLTELYQKYYADEPFVIVREAGQYPATKHALGSNACHIGAAVDRRTGRAVIFAAEDNLVKGMAGQAVQNMNLMCGLDEAVGLNGAGLWP